MSPHVDQITFQIIRHKLDSIVDEAIIALENVSGSPTTTEGHDMMVSLYTADGELMLGGVGFLHHITSAAQAVKHIIGRFEDAEGIHEGDVFFFNDSYSGALHPPDVFIITPIYFDHRRVGFVANFVHVSDIGAIDPGGFSPNARESYHEGFQTQGLKIVERGVPRRDVIETFLNNVRDPGMVALDLNSQMAANHVAHDRMVKLHAGYGSERVESVSRQLTQESEDLMRKRLLELPDGEWRVREYVDSGEGESYKAELTAIKDGDTLTYDFTGSDPQAPIGINCSYWATWGGMFAPIFPLLAWDITWNEGVTRPIRLIAPSGTVVNCVRPAPLSIATVSMINIVNNLSTIVISKMLAASKVYRRRATAVWYGSHSPITCYGTDASGEYYAGLLTDVFCGSGGGRAFSDGVDLGGEIPNVVSRWGNVEHHELRMPLLYLYRRVVPDSGGPGKFRGGLSHEYGFTPHGTGDNPLGLVCYGKGSYVPMSLGLFGGYPGCNTGYTTMRETNLDEWPTGLDAATGTSREDKQWGSQSLQPGDSEHLRLTAGGGYGDPLDRDPAAVVADVLSGAVSTVAARDLYGVVVGESGRRTDAAATAARRLELRAGRIDGDAADVRESCEVEPSGRRISEYLQQAGDGSTQCTWCAVTVAPAEADWKDHAVVRQAPLSNGGPDRQDDGRFLLLESFCPGCGTLLEVELTDGQDGPLHDRIHQWPEASGVVSGSVA
ncbi:MAG: Hydantoinase B/oxoprolinase [Solirubrobacterales bacterium]|nr:Hydantoinase B/oxoprolinase [Solirubrobacterales bacterium]